MNTLLFVLYVCIFGCLLIVFNTYRKDHSSKSQQQNLQNLQNLQKWKENFKGTEGNTETNTVTNTLTNTVTNVNNEEEDKTNFEILTDEVKDRVDNVKEKLAIAMNQLLNIKKKDIQLENVSQTEKGVYSKNMDLDYMLMGTSKEEFKKNLNNGNNNIEVFKDDKYKNLTNFLGFTQHEKKQNKLGGDFF